MHSKKSFIFIFTNTFYLLISALLVTWAIFVYLPSQQLIEKQEQYQKLTSLSAQQSVLMQKIVLSVYEYNLGHSDEKKLQIRSLMTQMESNHYFISKHLPSPTLQDYYQNGDALQTQIINYLEELKDYLSVPSLKKANALSLSSNQLLLKLHTVVLLLTDEHLALTEQNKEQTFLIYMISILTLFFIIFFILRPLLKNAQEYTTNLENEGQAYRHDIMIYSAIFDNAQEGIVLADSEEKIIKVNNAFTKITGYPQKEVLGKTPRILQSGVQKEDFYKEMWNKLEAAGIWSGKIINKNFQGKHYDELLTILKLYNKENDTTNFVSIFSDFSHLHETLDKFQKLIDLQNNIIIITDNTTILFANKRFFEFSGFDNLESFLAQYTCVCDLFIKNDHFFHLGKVSDVSTWVYALTQIPEEKRIILMMNKLHEQKSFKVMIDKYEDNTSIIVFTDISKNLMDKDILRDKAEKDKLTGCYNREYLHGIFDDFVQKRVLETKQTGIIIFDIDNFKSINDTYGHNRGDEVLKTLSKLLRRNTRKDDILIRWGGEEFIILFASSSFLEALRLAEKFRLLVESEYFEEIEHLTCSFGVTLYQATELLETTIERADKALYKAKKNGKNRVEIVEDIL